MCILLVATPTYMVRASWSKGVRDWSQPPSIWLNPGKKATPRNGHGAIYLENCQRLRATYSYLLGVNAHSLAGASDVAHLRERSLLRYNGSPYALDTSFLSMRRADKECLLRH